jgi:lipid II:glycine glycyltransferase (peptidoglycan interpeptide bridge formation enzyme)
MVDYYLERLDENNAVKWDEFNNQSPEGSFYHSLKWKKIIDKNSNFRTHYFLLFKNNSAYGIFPFVERTIYAFNGFIPVPDPTDLTAIIQDYNDPSSMQYVIKELRKINENHKKLSFICFSTLHKETIDTIKNYPIFPYGVDGGHMVLNLRLSPPEKIWDNFSAKKGQRKFIRRFDENGYSLTEIQSLDDLKLFYNYYQENIKFIGGTLQTFSHFTDLWNNFLSNEMRITLLSKNSTIAGGVLMLTFKPQKTVYLHYLSLNRNLPNTYHPSYYLFWEAINWAWNNGYEKVSFGTQHLYENNPRFRIKNDFGVNFEPIYSKMIPLTKLFILGYKCKQYLNKSTFLRKIS